MSNDYKKQLDEYKQMTEKQRAENKATENKEKTMEELLKESQEAMKKKEAELKAKFRGLKDQKTNVEFGDVIEDLKKKYKDAYIQVKLSLAETSKRLAELRAKRQERKQKEVEEGKEEIKEATIEEKVEEKIEEPKGETVEFIDDIEGEGEGEAGFVLRGKERVVKFFSKMDSKLEETMPGAYKYYLSSTKYFASLWKETFPNREQLVKDKMARVKKMAKEQNELENKIKDMSEEEIKKIQDSIPEHMRNALIIKAEEKKGTGGVWDIIANSDAAKELRKTKEYKEFTEIKKGVKELAETFKEGINESDNPILVGIRGVSVTLVCYCRI